MNIDVSDILEETNKRWAAVYSVQVQTCAQLSVYAGKLEEENADLRDQLEALKAG